MTEDKSQSEQILAPTPDGVERAAAHLKSGGLVAFPTETVYGLGADASNDGAVAHLFEVKGRPRFNPLIIHVAGREMAERCGEMTASAARLVDAFWPGPLTIVVPRPVAPGHLLPISALATAGLDSIALRMPAHLVARHLLEAVDRPIAAPSANRSGSLSPTRAEHIDLPPPPAGPLIVDAGPCEAGIESTIVDCTQDAPILLRHGAIALEDLVALGVTTASDQPVDLVGAKSARPTAPGQLARHYAPATPLRLNAINVEAGEALLAFGPDGPTGAAATETLSPSGDLREAAANLFAMLHRLDQKRCAAIAVMPIPDQGLGRAINDRLRRGASTT